MLSWFGSSGIRGPYDKITPIFCMKLGMAVGKSLKNTTPAYIASDIRYTSDLLKACFISGFCYSSGTIIDIGLCPTPIISHITSSNKDSLGVIVTASHNPPSNNGFKFFLNGGECGKDFEKKVENHLQQRLVRFFDNMRFPSQWKKVGIAQYKKSESYINEYVNYLYNKVHIKNQDRKIVLDCVNNVPNLVSPYVLRHFGFKVILINESLDPTFPGRPSEPTSENLATLKKQVIKEGADLGIAHDGDGDRFALIDERGEFINSTTIINFFLDNLDFSDPERRKIILTSDCTSQAFEIAKENSAHIVTSRIGRNRDFVNDEEVLFLAEPNKLLFPKFGKWIDGLYPVLKFIEQSGLEKVSKVLEPYDKRKILRKAFIIKEEKRSEVENSIIQLPDLWSENILDVSYLDGLKIFLKDQSHVLIRFSGTEPKIKFYIESNSETMNQNILNDLKDIFSLHSTGFDC
ncbi:MAG: hypothetical protein ACFFB2_10255 [Promethearchaeota archaeon]